MATKVSHQIVKAMPWLDGVAEKLRIVFDPIVGDSASPALKDTLVGTWLGHPLHPAIVQLPIGCWTSAALLDLFGHDESADLMVGFGLASSLGAVVTGAAQWVDATNDEQPRRLGALHATINTLGTAFYAASFLARRGDDRELGKTTSLVGLGLISLGALLGGDLAYDLGLGVNRNAFSTPPDKWTDVLAAGDLESGKPKRVEVEGVAVMLVKHDDGIHAISAVCPHLGGPLDEGKIDGEIVTCPWHGSKFCLLDGTLRHGPATAPVQSYEVRVDGDRIKIRAAV